MAKARTQRDPTRGTATILAAARALVLERGPDEVSLREIAARAGFSPAGLYEYFDGKDAILGAVAREVGARLSARMATVPVKLAAPRRLVRLGQAYLAFARESPQDYQLFFGKLRSKRSSAQQPVDPSSPYARVHAAAQAGLDAGELRGADGWGADQIAYGLWAMVHGMAMLQATHLDGFDADFEDTDRRALEAFVAGLRASPP